MLGKSQIASNRCVFSMIRGSWCSKSRPAKAAGAEVAVQQRHEKWHAAVARSAFVSQNVQKHLRVGPIFEIQMSKNRTPLSHLQVKMYKTPHVRSTFWSSEVQQSHAAVARSTFASQNVQSTACSEHFLKFRSKKKIARRCGAKCICKSKCANPLRFGTILELPMWKSCPTEEIDRLILNQSIKQSVS